MAPAKESAEVGVVESRHDNVVLGECIDPIPVIRKAKIHDAGPCLAAVSGFPHPAEFRGSITDAGARKCQVCDYTTQGGLQSP
jgi:hypothetical protein